MQESQKHSEKSNPDRTALVAFITVTTLFFAWGFITSMNDPLIPAVRAIFNLNYTESLLTQFAFFIAYGVVSIPGGAFVARIGYGRAILLALLAMITGCLCMPLATHLNSYVVILIALFIVASGITVLQVAANPLSAAMGASGRSHFWLTLSQAFNSLGTILGPWLGSRIMLRGGMFADQTATAVNRTQTLQNVDLAYSLMAALLAALVVFIWRMQPHLRAATRAPERETSVLAALKSQWAVLGALAIFFYVGAEVSVASVLINLLHRPDVFDISLERAGTLLGIFYWGGAMVGRFVGSALLTRIHAPRLLTSAAIVASILCLIVTQSNGVTVGVAGLAIGFFNSIMFPVIFSVTLERSTASAGSTSGLLCMAIVGGAILPPLTGRVADLAGLQTGFFLPMCAYAIIAIVAFQASKARTLRNASAAAH
jgi:FHS family L-fucose permease-like MFS transporter